MKIMLAGDIHGSAYYLEKLLDAFEKSEAETLVITGDILYHGPRNDLPKDYNPKKCIELLNPLADKLLCVRGNCEAEVDEMVLDFPVLADYCWLYINGRRLFVTHGHKYNPENPPRLQNGDVLVNGHTHIPANEQKDGFLYINPGSVSIPKENSHHSCIVTDGHTFEFLSLD